MFAAPTQFQGASFGESQAMPSPDSGSKKPARPEETCLPVTIRAVEAAFAQRGDTGEDLKFFGAEPGVLVLVAMVESVVRQSTGLEMVLNDATGRIKARYFVTDPLPGELEAIQPGRYISAFGSARAAPAPHFAANGVRLVAAADEVSYHMIEVAHAMLRLQQPQAAQFAGAPVLAKKADSQPPRTPEKATAAQQPSTEGGAAAAMAPTPEQQPVPPVAAAAAPAAAATTGLQGPALQAAVTAVLRNDSENEEGLAAGAIAERIGRGVAVEDVRVALAALNNAGEVFATIDEEHFALL